MQCSAASALKVVGLRNFARDHSDVVSRGKTKNEREQDAASRASTAVAAVASAVAVAVLPLYAWHLATLCSDHTPWTVHSRVAYTSSSAVKPVPLLRKHDGLINQPLVFWS